MKLLVYVRTVLWGFIGIGSRGSNSEDLTKVRPLGLLAVAAVLLALFGLTLYGVATLAVSSLQ